MKLSKVKLMNMMKFFSFRHSTLAMTTVAAAIACYLATIPNPTRPQQDLGHTANQMVLLGSQQLLKSRRTHREHDKKQNLAKASLP